MNTVPNAIQLHDFDGKTVLTTGIKVTRAGDGLSSALQIEPREFAHGEIVHVVLECEVTNISFVPLRDSDGLQRVHTLQAGAATIVDRAIVRKALDAQRKKIEEAAGVRRLFDDDPSAADAGTD